MDTKGRRLQAVLIALLASDARRHHHHHIIVIIIIIVIDIIIIIGSRPFSIKTLQHQDPWLRQGLLIKYLYQ